MGDIMDTCKQQNANAIVKQVDFNVALEVATMEKVTWAPKG